MIVIHVSICKYVNQVFEYYFSGTRDDSKYPPLLQQFTR